VEIAAIVKLGRHLPKVKRVLRQVGRLSDAVYVERASLPEQRVRPFAEIDEAPYFSVVLVGRTAAR